MCWRRTLPVLLSCCAARCPRPACVVPAVLAMVAAACTWPCTPCSAAVRITLASEACRCWPQLAHFGHLPGHMVCMHMLVSRDMCCVLCACCPSECTHRLVRTCLPYVSRDRRSCAQGLVLTCQQHMLHQQVLADGSVSGWQSRKLCTLERPADQHPPI